jgi:adenylate cyclase
VDEAGRQAPESGAALAARYDARLTRAGLLSNALGALTVFLFLSLLAPRTVDADVLEDVIVRSAIAFVPYMAVTLPLGRMLTRRRYFVPLREWLLQERPATEAERVLVLRYPLAFALRAGVFWEGAAVLFPLLNVSAGTSVVLGILVTVVLGGATACALQYLLVERIVRPLAERALAGAPPPPGTTPGVATRLTMAWTLATGAPLLGVIAAAVPRLAGADIDEGQLVMAMFALALLAIVVGYVATVVAARSVGDPLNTVRHALERVEGGDLEVQVPVSDGSEVGLLQAGFNRMTRGLAERERLRDLFGRHVGRDVARAALDGEVRLGGEVRDVAAMFVDLVGSTSLAASRPPTEVVDLLNGFFRVVVESTERHGGWINKFEGDAALCVFGAPTPNEHCASDALAAARELRSRLDRELPELEAGIGVSAGPAVAGNVGAEERFEYTVIGDPVNEAARLCELSKQRPGRLLASATALERAGEHERERWSLGDEVTLRGRPEATRLATPAG